MIKRNEYPWIYICIHKEQREFDGKLYLASYLSSLGFNVVLAKTGFIKQNYNKFPLGVVIDVTASSTRDNYFKALKGFGHQVAIFDEEAIAYGSGNQYKKTRLSGSALRNVDCYFTWGEKHSALVREVMPMVNAVAVGHPRIDVLKKNMRSLYSNEVKRLQEKYGRFILVASHGGILFNNEFVEKEIRKNIQRGVLSDETDIVCQRKDYYKYHKSSAEELIKFTYQLHDKVNTNVVYRPKPTGRYPETSHKIDALIPDFESKIFIDAEGSIVPWLMAAECVVHHNSVAALEAFLCGTPVFEYAKKENIDYDSVLPKLVSTKIESIDDFLSRFRGIDCGSLLEKSNIHLDKYVSSLSDIDSVELISDELRNLVEANESKDYYTNVDWILDFRKASGNFISAKRVFRWLGSEYRRVFGKPNIDSASLLNYWDKNSILPKVDAIKSSPKFNKMPCESRVIVFPSMKIVIFDAYIEGT